MGDVEQEINLDEITDESLLNNLLDQTEDIDDRKAIRARIAELRAAEKAKREQQSSKSRVTENSIENRREDRLQQKMRDAQEQKQRTLAMYDAMAKSAPAGTDKKMDIGIYRNSDATPPPTPKGAISGVRTTDLVEDALRQRQRNAEERKKRMLAAYEAASRACPAGVAQKEVNFEAFKKADVSNYEPVKGDSGATFSMSGGVPKVTKPSLSQPGTPLSPGFPGGMIFPKADDHLDAMEKMIRARKQEAEERKKRTLAAFDIIAKQGAGPKVVCIEEFKDLDVKNHKIGTKYSGTAGFGGGVFSN